MNQTILGLDYGKARIGVAILNTLTGLATPQTTIYAKAGVPDWLGLSAVIKEWKPSRLVVGMPRKLDGSDSAMQAPILAFIAQLQTRYALPIDMVNEQLSSREAEQRLKLARQAGRKRKITKEQIDQVAAAIILENWMQDYVNAQQL
jgi:putative Holliday junction resolvase